MLVIHDLYDLYAIFLNIRMFPNNRLNADILSKVIDVLENRHINHDKNQFRTALRSICSKDDDIYKFVFVENLYTYSYAFLKNEYIYAILIESCRCLLDAVKQNKTQKIVDLADCLHNLPIFISENKYTIPKDYWKNEVKYYRDKWDKDFLKKEQKYKKV